MPTLEAGRGRRLRWYVAVSVLAWAGAISLAFSYLRRAQPAHLRTLPLTHADSIGLPLVAWALAVAAVLVVANLGVAVMLRRRRRQRRVAAPGRRPAG